MGFGVGRGKDLCGHLRSCIHRGGGSEIGQGVSPLAGSPEREADSHALDPGTGKIVWSAPATPCAASRTDCSPAQSAAVTAIPGVVFSGSVDGHLRAYSASTGRVLWDTDTARDFATVNGKTVRWRLDRRCRSGGRQWHDLRQLRLWPMGRHARKCAPGVFSAVREALRLSAQIKKIGRPAKRCGGCQKRHMEPVTVQTSSSLCRCLRECVCTWTAFPPASGALCERCAHCKFFWSMTTRWCLGFSRASWRAWVTGSSRRPTDLTLS